MKKSLYFIFLSCLLGPVYGQDYKDAFNYAPRSPEAARLIEDIEIPVSTYTGTAEVAIPIWSFNQQGLSQSMTLSYRTGGIKVNQVASSVGIGWNLQAQPMITRKVNGLPDEIGSGLADLRGFLSIRDDFTYDAIVQVYNEPHDSTLERNPQLPPHHPDIW